MDSEEPPDRQTQVSFWLYIYNYDVVKGLWKRMGIAVGSQVAN